MNKTILLLIALSLALLLSFRFYNDQKNRTLSAYGNFVSFKEKALKVAKLQKAIQTPPPNPEKCEKRSLSPKKVRYICKNIDKNEFSRIERTFFKKIVPLFSFELKRNKRGLDLTLEVAQ